MKPSFYAGEKYGGESGIRTHVTLSSKHAFQACAFSHSAISPARTCELRIFKTDTFAKQAAVEPSRLLSFYGRCRNRANATTREECCSQELPPECE